jgi:hypothetical protein
MLRLFKTFSALAVLGLAAQTAFGFALIGPISVDTWQVSDLGYFVPGREDVGAPKGLGEEYRRNNPTLYYACDGNFLDFFGSNGVAAVDQAFSVFNALTNVSAYSGDLSEIPLESTRDNFFAESLSILDLKSATMTLIIEELGLADAVRYVWDLHLRNLPPGAPPCPLGEEYEVVMRNFDPTVETSLSQMKVSQYVNGVLYDYQIHDYCSLPPGVQDALSEALEISVDPDADLRIPVARTRLPTGFFTGLTRDDVGGLRYLISQNNMNVESAGPGTTVFTTNNTPFAISTTNLTTFAAQALTNTAAALVALYPGLTILSTSNNPVLVTNTTITAFFTNSPTAPFNSPATLVFTTNTTLSVGTNFYHTFGNVFLITNSSHGLTTTPLSTIPAPNGFNISQIQTITITSGASPYTPVGSATTITNISTRTFATNQVVGDFFILPPGLCGVGIVRPLFSALSITTNLIFSATNSVTNTTGVTVSNVVTSVTQNLLTVSTNRTFVALPITCGPDTPTLREGIEKITFIRRDFDSLLSRTYIPLTNEYYLQSVQNNAVLGQRVQRAVTQPDFLITATDLTPGPTGTAFVNNLARSTPNYNSANANPGLAGPGTIENPCTFTFNKSAPVFYNTGMVNTNAFLTSQTQTPIVIWGSFDGTTNLPVIYPSGLSIDNLAAQALVQINPLYLPSGFLGSQYPDTQFQTQVTPTWQGSFTWDLATGSPGLPPGLELASDGSGLISGTPTQTGTFDFVIRVTDTHSGRSEDRSFFITVTQ